MWYCHTEQEFVAKLNLTWLAVEGVYVIIHDIPAPFAAYQKKRTSCIQKDSFGSLNKNLEGLPVVQWHCPPLQGSSCFPNLISG